MSATIPTNTVSANGVGDISDAQLNTYVQNAGVIANLRNFTGITNMTVITLGTSTPGDGGGLTYYWSPNSIAADNGTTIIAPNGVLTGRWLALPFSFTVANLTVTGNLVVDGTGAFTGMVDMSEGANITGPVNIETLDVTGTIDVIGTIEVSGPITATGTVGVGAAVAAGDAPQWGQVFAGNLAVWNDVHTVRAFGTSYTNAQLKPIEVSAWGTTTGADQLQLQVPAGTTVGIGNRTTGSSQVAAVQGVVPAGSTYEIVNTTGSVASSGWWELY